MKTMLKINEIYSEGFNFDDGLEESEIIEIYVVNLPKVNVNFPETESAPKEIEIIKDKLFQGFADGSRIDVSIILYSDGGSAMSLSKEGLNIGEIEKSIAEKIWKERFYENLILPPYLLDGFFEKNEDSPFVEEVKVIDTIKIDIYVSKEFLWDSLFRAISGLYNQKERWIGTGCVNLAKEKLNIPAYYVDSDKLQFHPM